MWYFFLAHDTYIESHLVIFSPEGAEPQPMARHMGCPERGLDGDSGHLTSSAARHANRVDFLDVDPNSSSNDAWDPLNPYRSVSMYWAP